MKPLNYIKDGVYCVGGKAYYMNFPVRCKWLTFLPLVAFFVTGNQLHILGIVMVVLGLAAANARFSPVHGCLVWLPLIGLAIWSVSQPELALPLIAWGAGAWIAGCIECRLTLVPHAEFNKDSARSA